MTIFFEDLKSSPQTFLIFDSCLKLTGADAQAYLHSQTTNDVNKLEDGEFQFNTLLDSVGKIVSSFILCRENQKSYHILLNQSYLEATSERIEKFHISEEFDVEKLNIYSYLKTHDSEGPGYKGQYIFEDDTILLSHDKLAVAPQLDLYHALCGIQVFDRDNIAGELINNTCFDELAVDYQKGCYPGQETVAKIHTRRGAAYKPVLVIFDYQVDLLTLRQWVSQDKRVSKLHSAHDFEGRTYACASVGREYRVENLQITLEGGCVGTIRFYPYISPKKKNLALELYDEAVDVFQAGDNTRALDLFQKSIKLDPTYEDAYESLGVLYGRLGEFNKAIELMKKLKELNPKCMMALTNLSLYHMKLGDIETAEKFKSDATLLNFQLLGDEADQKRKQEELERKRLTERDKREQMFKQVLEIDSADAMANNGLGEIAFEKSNYQDAKEYFSNALEGDQKYSVAYLGLGKSLVELSEIEEAKKILSQGITIASKNGDMMPANEMQALILRIS